MPIDEGSIRDGLGDWTSTDQPLYLALADGLEAMIDDGSLPPGTRLPAERKLADLLAVSRGTVVAAYDELRQGERVQTRRGSGTVVLEEGSPIQSPREAHVAASLNRNSIFAGVLTDADSLDFRGAYWVGTEDLPSEALTVTAADLDATGHGYFPAGLPVLRERLADYLTDLGLPTTPRQVIVTTGAQQAIDLVTQLLVEAGDEVVVEELTYPGAIDAFLTANARVRWVPMTRHGVDVHSLSHAIRRHRPRLAYLIPSVHNPTGTVLPDPARRLIAEAAEDHETVVVDDMTLAETTFDGSVATPLAMFAPDAPILTIGSLSKSMWGGFRIGFIRGPESTLARLARLKATTDLGTPVASQIVAARLLPEAASIRERRSKEIRHRYEVLTSLLTEHLPDWEWDEPAGGMVLWTKLPEGDSAGFQSVAAHHGVGVAPGSVSSASGDHGDHLRLPFGARPETITEVIVRLADAWEDYRGRLTRCDRVSVYV